MKALTQTSNMAIDQKTKDEIKRFVELVSNGIESWIEAGKLVAERMDKDPLFIDKITASVPGIQRDTILQFDRIGRGRIEPRLLLSSNPGPKRLLRLPVAEQRRYMNNPVPVLIKGSSGWEVLETPVDNITKMQARQVFADDHVRSEGEQRAWIESQKAIKELKTPRQANEPYRISTNKLVVLQPCQFTARQLASILAQIER